MLRPIQTRTGLILGLLLLLIPALSPGIWLHAQNATPAPTPLPTLPPIAISATVSSGTANASLPTALILTLHLFRNDASGATQEILTQPQPLPADGKLHFGQMQVQIGDIGVITTQYQGIVQGSAPIVFDRTSGSAIDMPVTLYLITHDAATIRISRDDQVLNFLSKDLLSVLETVEWTATGDHIFLSSDKTSGGQPISVTVPLPVGARAIAFNSQPISRFAIVGDVNSPIVADTSPIVPGITHQVIFSYQIPYANGAFLDRTYPVATSALQVFIPDDTGVALQGARGSAFTSAPNHTINPQRPYTAYTLNSPIAAQGRVIYALSGIPGVLNSVTSPKTSPAAPSPFDFGLGGVLIGIGGLIVVLAALWGVRRWLITRSAKAPTRTRVGRPR